VRRIMDQRRRAGKAACRSGSGLNEVLGRTVAAARGRLMPRCPEQHLPPPALPRPVNQWFGLLGTAVAPSAWALVE